MTQTTKIINNFFLQYQKDWLNDNSKVKLAAKSRRIGFTWVQSFEDVRDALTLKIRNKVCDIWFTSADLSAAKEYINYCKYWAKALNAGLEDLGEIVIDEDKDIKALSLEFKNGARINAISSNPSAFRSKGGKVVIDEFAFHKNPNELWKAAKPVITWGYPLRIISSLNGTNNLFYKFIQLIKQGKLKCHFMKLIFLKLLKMV
jgi:phage FluMu gp28-like protein